MTGRENPSLEGFSTPRFELIRPFAPCGKRGRPPKRAPQEEALPKSRATGWENGIFARTANRAIHRLAESVEKVKPRAGELTRVFLANPALRTDTSQQRLRRFHLRRD